jgi:hypothetical protein
MYDFYGNPPKTKEQIREYLTTWLEPVNEKININNEDFIQDFGFRRAFHLHCILKSADNQYLWWVFQDNELDIKNFPTKRFNDIDSLINYVVDDYYIQWKLS